MCAMANTINFLIFSRILCAAGGCGMMVCAFAVIRDLYNDKKAGEMISFLNACIAVSPVFAPVIGGYLASWIDWRANFYFLFIIGLYTLITVIKIMPETHSIQNRINID